MIELIAATNGRGENANVDEYKYLGNFAACEPWAAVYMQCDDCSISWTGCWDNFECPQCRKGTLPGFDDERLRYESENSCS